MSNTSEDLYREALVRIGELLQDWPTMRALSASGAERATANKREAARIIDNALNGRDLDAGAPPAEPDEEPPGPRM